MADSLSSNSLSEKLRQLADSDYYPFHMPGHKRNFMQDFMHDKSQSGRTTDRNPDSINALFPYNIDITEIDGFDDLHDAKGILKAEQDKAASVYDSKWCFYLVNGSTCGNLAAICASVSRNGHILVADNCHRSVRHAIELMQLKAEYVSPQKTLCGIPGQILPEDIEQKLNENPDIQAVVVTSPTYDGVVSDIEEIAKITHKHDIPLIVDEAHGAHLGFHPSFPENATRLNADAVIMSLHKTLPSLTQTSLLHICSDRIDAAKIEKYLDIFETSSPSYVLMDSISRCVKMISEPSIYDIFDAYAENIADFTKRTEVLSHIKIIGAKDFTSKEAFSFDIGKIIIDTTNVMPGYELYDILLNKYHLQLEYAKPTYALAMTSIMDTKEGFDRLAEALLEIDRSRS